MCSEREGWEGTLALTAASSRGQGRRDRTAAPTGPTGRVAIVFQECIHVFWGSLPI